ncbi:TPA: hypothetical protein ACH3X1_007103 [Trebouxia sp. C0004]
MISPLIANKWEAITVAWHPGQALARSVQNRLSNSYSSTTQELIEFCSSKNDTDMKNLIVQRINLCYSACGLVLRLILS